MDITSLSGISTNYLDTYSSLSKTAETENGDSFGTILNSMLSAVNETNDLQNLAESAEIQFALGESDNIHDLLIAQTKATVALQYTVAVRDKLLDAYREIMQMQIQQGKEIRDAGTSEENIGTGS